MKTEIDSEGNYTGEPILKKEDGRLKMEDSERALTPAVKRTQAEDSRLPWASLFVRTIKHSPLPWHVAEYGIRELKAKYLCIKHGNKTIARIDASGNSLSVTKQDEANAALIVRAVNNADQSRRIIEKADKLAEALRDCMADLDHYASTHGPGPDRRRDAAKAALAAYEEAAQ